MEEASEDGYAGVLRFTRIGNLSGSLTANYSVSGTATSGTDFTSIGTSVGFAAGAATADVEVAALHDSLYDPGETVIATVTTGTGYSVGSPSSATVTIYDDASHTFEVASEDGAVWYEVDWSQWDSDDHDPQELALTDFTLLFAGQTFTTSNATITDAVAVVGYNETTENHEVADIRFNVVFASTVAGVKTLVAADGEVTAFNASSQQIGDPDDLLATGPPALAFDFSKMAFPTETTTWTWTISAKVRQGTDFPSLGQQTIQITSENTAAQVQAAVKLALEGLGCTCKIENGQLEVTGPTGKELYEVKIDTDAAGPPAGPSAIAVQNSGMYKPRFIWD